MLVPSRLAGQPENILLKEDTPDSIIKLADFGFAHTFVVGENELRTCLGTPGYVAPEIITKQKYGPAVDVWSLGVIFYILLCGYPPFLADTRAALFRCIMKGRYEFHDDAWGNISQDAKDFISRMLVRRQRVGRRMWCVCPDERGSGTTAVRLHRVVIARPGR